jgi:PTS system nitrogen regulatory IIA component
MKISGLISVANVMVDVRAADKSQLLRDLAQVAASALQMPPELIAAELNKREQLGSTGMGNGIAIPHARFAALAKPFGILARLRQPIEFDAIDGQRVDLIFVLLLPASPDGEQLGALACVARQLRLPSVIDRLRRLKQPAELYAAIIDSPDAA